MSTASGIDSQLGYVTESTVGTFEVPTRFAEFNSESLKLEIERVDSAGIRAGRRTLHRWSPGVQRITGDLEKEFDAGDSLLLFHAMGAVNTTGAGDPYTHTLTPGTLDGKSFTLQVNRPDISGTDRVFSYLGCKSTTFDLSASAGEYATLKLGFYGEEEDTGQALATASYGADAPFIFTQGALTIGGTAVDIRDFNITVDNGLATDRHFIRSGGAVPKEALEGGRRSISGSFSADFEDLVQYGLYTAGTEAALILTFDDSANDRSCVITANVRFDGETPNVGGHEILELPVSFTAVSTTSDAAALTIDMENALAAP